MSPVSLECGSGEAGDPCCPATNLLLAEIAAAVADLDGNTDTIEALLTAISTAVADLDINTDGLEACCEAGNVLLQAILDAVDELEDFTNDIETILGTLVTCCDAQTVTLGDILTSLTVIETNTTPVERLVDGADITGVDTITIPDGVSSFGVTVFSAGAGVTIDGPDFAAPVNLYDGQSIGHSADSGNTLNGPIDITGTAGSVVNAIWVKP